jgi:DNA gyrase/topoisomerase IV subunit A
MENSTLRQIIRESIQSYIREIDEAGNVAALEAKMAKTKEAIEERKSKMAMEGLDEAYHEMLDKGKVKEIEKEIKHLEKSLAKYEKQLEKMKSKGKKKTEEPMEETKEMVDEMTSEVEEGMTDENYMEEEEISESFLHMQKLAGVLSEEEYNKKVEEARFKKGTDIGKKGKGFEKIAKSAEEEYGSEEAGKRVAGAILKKVLAKK